MGSKQRSEILLVGNELSANDGLRRELIARAYGVTTACVVEDGLEKAKARRFDAVVSDLLPSGPSGLELLKHLHPAKPQLPIILIDRHANVERAIEASKLGAYEYVTTPIEILELVEHIVRAASQKRQVLRAAAAGHPKATETGLVGSSRIMQELYKQIGLAADSSLAILIRGETGTGKELIAHAIHEHSSRANKPFVAFNCNAIPETLFESELFGFEAGAFTGARARRIGGFERANGGTLFLDEIGDLTLAAQVKLLRVLQEQRIQRLGGSQEIRLDVRVVTATHRDLELLMNSKEFRQDLFYRLGGLTIKAPELCEHREDIFALTQHFLLKCQTDKSLQPQSIDREAVEFFEKQAWPGNVRELESAVYRAALLARGQAIDLTHARAACGHTNTSPSARYYRPEPLTDLVERARTGDLKNLRACAHEQLERSLLERLFPSSKGNQTKLAKWLGVTRKTLRQILGKYGFLKLGPKHHLQPDPPNQSGRQTNRAPRPAMIRGRDKTAGPDNLRP
jgi:DNA-binding NtrC family response regulator